MDPQLKKAGCPESYWTHHTADSPESLYLGGQVTKIPDCVAMTAPATYLTPNAPASMLLQGTARWTKHATLNGDETDHAARLSRVYANRGRRPWR